MTNTPRHAMPEIAANQAQKHVTHNLALQILDALDNASIIDRDLATPPGSPVDGDLYLIAGSPTGAWAGQAGKLGFRYGGAWSFYPAFKGLIVYVADEGVLIIYNGTVWVSLLSVIGALQNLSLLGVNTTADATNKLAVASSAILLTNVGNGIQVKVNKAAAADTGSFLFQDAFSGRAEIGLMGDDDFRFKVSPDGSAFFTSIRKHRLVHGRAALKEAMRKAWAAWLPRPGAAAVDNIGLGVVDTGTLTAVSPSASNLFTQSPRAKFVSAAGAGSSTGRNGSALYLWRGNAADMGGFYLRIVGGIEVFQTNCRMFMGLYSSAAVIGNVNPSTLLNLIGVGFDSADTTLQLMTNDGTGAATKTSLGAGFPTTGGQDVYELILSAEPNASEVRYRVERLNGGDVAEGAVTTDLPVNTQFMTPHLWFNNGTTAAAVETALIAMYAENASMLGSRNAL